MSLIIPRWAADGILKAVPKHETANFTAEYGAFHIIDAGTGNINVTLPPAASRAGAVISVKPMDADLIANVIQVTPTGTENIDGSNTTIQLSSDKQTAVFVSDGVDWFRY